MKNSQQNDGPLSNVEFVTIAVYQLGGVTRPVDIEDVAHLSNKLAPGRFAWRKYPDQISLQDVRFALENAKRTHCGYVRGDSDEGWMVTEGGALFAESNFGRAKLEQPGRQRDADKNWKRREKERILASAAYAKFRDGQATEITALEAKSFFRIDEYVNHAARTRKVSRLVNVFRGDREVGPAVVALAERLKGGPNNGE